MALPSRAVWVTDARLALWVLLASVLARFLGARSALVHWSMGVSGVLVAAAAVTVVTLAQHAAACVFNRARPLAPTTALFRFTLLLNPLETLFRLATAPLRVLPDVYIVGEVRCGTTTTATLLKRMPGTHGPFCPWIHPLGDKESFFLVGHYWGLVDPSLYRMCFPLRLTRWVHTRLLRRRFVVYDACAQYLTAPWVPHLIRKATPHAKLIVCIRDPVLQNLSWWRYELAAMAWGDSLALGPTGRPSPLLAAQEQVHYPPDGFAQAIDRSRGDGVGALYRAAEGLRGAWLPRWAVAWPLGQLNALTQCGRFMDNLDRFLGCFDRSQLAVVDLGELKDSARVYERLCGFLDVPHDRHAIPLGEAGAVWANRSRRAEARCEPDAATLRRLGRFYRPHNLRLFAWLGRELDWHHASHYADDPP